MRCPALKSSRKNYFTFQAPKHLKLLTYFYANSDKVEQMEIISNIALISINETMVIQIISFLIFMLILNRVMIRPLRGSMSEREIYIEKLWTGIANSKKEMEEITTQIETHEASAREAAHSIQKETEALGNKEADGVLEAAKQDVTLLRKQTKAEIEAMLKVLQKSLQKESESIAVSFMEKTLSRRLAP